MPDKQKSHFERFLRPILASRFLTVSALIHLVQIALVGGQVLFNKYVEPPDFTSTGDDAVSTDAAPAPPPPSPDDTLPPAPSLSAPPPPPSAPAANLAALTSMSTSQASFQMPIPQMAPPTIAKITTMPVQQFNSGPEVGLPGVMSARSGNGRGEAGRKYGEKSASEEAVLRALRWLQSQQHSDGTWGDGEFRSAFTGLALLCFLGHGETPDHSQEFSVVVTNAINAMVQNGQSNQGRMDWGPGFDGIPAVYEHAIGTYAISEAYTMTKDQRLAPIVSQAVTYIVNGQRPDGGWAYSYDTGEDPRKPDAKHPIKSDTSVSGWQIQALKAAHLTGIAGTDKLGANLDQAMRNMDRVFDPHDGTFGYRSAGDIKHHDLTGVGALAKLFWLGRADKSVREGLKNITTTDLVYGSADCNLYGWYYDTQACFQAQGAAWDWWNKRFQDQLTTNQSADGSWPPTGGTDTGGEGKGNSFSKQTGGSGPLYRTVFCCLMLEVFYRYLPTNGGANALDDSL
jgi:hypothetical protein